MIDSLNAREMTTRERAVVMQFVVEAIQREALTFGEALRYLRAVYLRISRQDLAARVDLSVAQLSALEQGRSNPTLKTLRAVFKPFGLRVGLYHSMGQVPVSAQMTQEDYDQLLSSVKEKLAQQPRGRKR